jgi:hypothetical protein
VSKSPHAVSRPPATVKTRVFRYELFAGLVCSAGFMSAYGAFSLPEFRVLQEFELASVADSRKDSTAFSGFSTQNSLKVLRIEHSSQRKFFLGLVDG